MALMARNPSLRLRQAVQSESLKAPLDFVPLHLFRMSNHRSLLPPYDTENDLNLVMRLRYKTDLRNTDERRLTSLAWAALSVSEDVFEWLLLDAGHDDDELSRVSPPSRCHSNVCGKSMLIPTVGLDRFLGLGYHTRIYKYRIRRIARSCTS